MGHGRHTDLVDNLGGKFRQTAGQAHARLGHKIDGAQFEGAHGHFSSALRQRGDHHHRHGAQAHQTAQEVDPVHARHFDIKRDDIGIRLPDHLARDQWVIGGADALHVVLSVDDFGQ